MNKMGRFMRSLLTAGGIALAVQIFAVYVLAPRLPIVRGRPVVMATRTLELEAASCIELDNRDGSARFRARQAGPIAVTAEVRAYVSDKTGAAVARAYAETLIETVSDGAALRIVTEPGERPEGVEVQVDYTIEAPAGVSVSVDSVNGNVWVSRGFDAVRVTGQNCDVEIVEPAGPVTAHSANGRIRVLDAQADTSIDTLNGNVYAHMRAGALTARTTNGAIVARMLAPNANDFELESLNGGITLILSDGCAGQVDAETGLGIIRSDFPVDCTQGARRRRRLQGVIGEDGGRLVMRTLNGNIWIAGDRL